MMSSSPTPAPPQSSVKTTDNLLSLISIAIVACVSADMVHEAVGHGILSWLTGDKILMLSTVALQNAVPNRLVSAAGTSANCIVGALAFLLLRRSKTFNSGTYFLWLFGAFNLLNVGYLAASAATNNGDWANVIAGLSPPLLWRAGMAMTGAILIYLFVWWSASVIAPLLDRESRSRDGWRLVLPAYLAAGTIMTIASVFNPFSPRLILPSGVGASFGLNAGLLFVPAIVAGLSQPAPTARRVLPLSIGWIVLAVLLGGIFVEVLGPGIRF